MARKSGRGLFLGKEDFIPLERVDLLDDLKRLVDVHRITDFSLSDKVQPTIELRRTEDELIAMAHLIGQAGAAAAVATIQLFVEPLAAPTGLIARPLFLQLSDGQADTVNIGYLPFSGGGVTVANAADPRRQAEIAALATGMHGDNVTAAMGAVDTLWRIPVNVNEKVWAFPESVLQRMAAMAGRCLTFQTTAIGVAPNTLSAAVVYRLEKPRLTRA